MDAVEVVCADEMEQHVGRIRRRGRMAEVDVPIRTKLITALARLRAPLPRTAIRPLRLRIPEMLQEDMICVARKRAGGWIAVKDRADDHERVDLNPACVRGIEQRAQRIERAVHR